jgi:hypothetical protein
MVDLLATCAEGENRFIESVCQNIFSYKTLLAILSDKTIVDMQRKIPFMRFLLWVYLSTAAGPIESGVSSISAKPDMWASLAVVLAYLRPLVVNVSAMRGRDLRKRFDKHVLNALFEGIFPFLAAFYGDLYNDDTIGSNEQQLSIELGRVVFELLYIGDKIVKDHLQFSLLKSTAMTMCTRVKKMPAGDVSRLTAFLQEHTQGKKHVMTDTQQQYLAKYADQEEINDILNTWVVAVQKVYHTLDGFAEDEEDVEGDTFDADLPRGKEFLDHMSVFVRYTGGAPIIRGKPSPIEEINEFARKLVIQLQTSLLSVKSLNDVRKIALKELNLKSIQVCVCVSVGVSVWTKDRRLSSLAMTQLMSLFSILYFV